MLEEICQQHIKNDWILEVKHNCIKNYIHYLLFELEKKDEREDAMIGKMRTLKDLLDKEHENNKQLRDHV